MSGKIIKTEKQRNKKLIFGVPVLFISLYMPLHDGLKRYQNINNIFIKILGSYFTFKIKKNNKTFNFIINSEFN